MIHGRPLDLLFIGLSISSSWGNGHATTYRALIRGLAERGHRVTFLEWDAPWYAAHRDLPAPDFCRLDLYHDLADLAARRPLLAEADAVIVGSYVREGVAVGRLVQQVAAGVTAFYDIDTPVTLAKLAAGDFEYLEPALIPGYDLYLSFTGGPTLDAIERHYGAPAAHALYCSVDTALYAPVDLAPTWDLSYLGTYSEDRQPALEQLLLEPARARPDLRFAVGGSGYPQTIAWPHNVERLEHVPPAEHPGFYGRSRLTLNVTRRDMVRAGYSPSVRLFEAAACAVPIVSDAWPGIETIFQPEREIILAEKTADVLSLLDRPGGEMASVGQAARARVLAAHSGTERAAELELHIRKVPARSGAARAQPRRMGERLGRRAPPLVA